MQKKAEEVKTMKEWEWLVASTAHANAKDVIEGIKATCGTNKGLEEACDRVLSVVNDAIYALDKMMPSTLQSKEKEEIKNA